MCSSSNASALPRSASRSLAALVQAPSSSPPLLPSPQDGWPSGAAGSRSVLPSAAQTCSAAASAFSPLPSPTTAAAAAEALFSAAGRKRIGTARGRGTCRWSTSWPSRSSASSTAPPPAVASAASRPLTAAPATASRSATQWGTTSGRMPSGAPAPGASSSSSAIKADRCSCRAAWWGWGDRSSAIKAIAAARRCGGVQEKSGGQDDRVRCVGLG
mmetsp:Transcript_27797/g.82395  ORF Transcript_27797/g.82395 Transcript_27797/m.82395 type:complete len:215 (+) Transcript_27797:2651-3295(+)